MSAFLSNANIEIIFELTKPHHHDGAGILRIYFWSLLRKCELNGALVVAAILGLRGLLLVERPVPALKFAIPLAVVSLSGSCVKLECAGLSGLDALEFFCLPHV